MCRKGVYWVIQKLPQIYTANNAIFPIRIRKLTVKICGNFWVTQTIFLSATRSGNFTKRMEYMKSREHWVDDS